MEPPAGPAAAAHPAARPPRTPLAVMASTLRAVFLREIRNRFGRYRTGYFWALAEPALQVALMLLIFRGMRGGLSGTFYGEHAAFFFTLGVLPFLMFSHAADRSVGSIAQNRAIFNLRQIRPPDVVLVKALIEFLIYGFVLLMFLAVGHWFGYGFVVHDPLRVLLVMFLLFWMACGMAMFFDVVITLQEWVRRPFALLMRVLFFASGVFYSIDHLPKTVRPYLMFNPLLHAIDKIREAAIPAYESVGDLRYVALWSALAMFFGLAAYQRFRHRLF